MFFVKQLAQNPMGRFAAEGSFSAAIQDCLENNRCLGAEFLLAPNETPRDDAHIQQGFRQFGVEAVESCGDIGPFLGSSRRKNLILWMKARECLQFCFVSDFELQWDGRPGVTAPCECP